jgi:hypothetical protein
MPPDHPEMHVQPCDAPDTRTSPEQRISCARSRSCSDAQPAIRLAGQPSGSALLSRRYPPPAGRQLTSAPPWGFKSVPAAFCIGSGHCGCHMGPRTLRPPGPPGAIVRQGANPRILIAAAASCLGCPEQRTAQQALYGQAGAMPRKLRGTPPHDHPGSCYLHRVNIPEPGIYPRFACSSPSDTLNPHERPFTACSIATRAQPPAAAGTRSSSVP